MRNARTNEEVLSNAAHSTPRRLRFRGSEGVGGGVGGGGGRIEEVIDDDHSSAGTHPLRFPIVSFSSSPSVGNNRQQPETVERKSAPSFRDFFRVEITRGYILEHDEERYTARRKKIHSFFCIPRDLERFMLFGLMQCADSFFYIHTFLPIRCAMALWSLLSRSVGTCLGWRRRGQLLMTQAEICDVLKFTIWAAVIMAMLAVDTNRVYHIIKSQSIIKLYIFYNMLEVGDRLLSAFGQDMIDALFWTATESKDTKRDHFSMPTHILFVLIYVILHSILIMFQATTLNVAVNSNNKGLMTIMISNNFVELKGSVFKKFDKNNLFQLSCSDVRERFHLTVLLFIVIIQTMKEFDWTLTHFTVMMPDCFAVLFTEILIDWIKHAFITRFNELNETIYREYTTSLAYDTMQTRQKHAFSDHSDLVARRMGFIPFPLGVVLIKAIYSAVTLNNFASWLIFALAFAFVFGLRIALTICALGKACKLMKEHQEEKCNLSSTPNSMTNVVVPPIVTNNSQSTNNNNYNLQHNSSGISLYQFTPPPTSSSTSLSSSSSTIMTNISGIQTMNAMSISPTNSYTSTTSTCRFDVNLSPIQPVHHHHHPHPQPHHHHQHQSLQVRGSSVDSNRTSSAPNSTMASPSMELQTIPSTVSCKSDPGSVGKKTLKDNINNSCNKATSMMLSNHHHHHPHHHHHHQSTCNDLNVKDNLDLGATALFSNSDVDLDDICLNEHLLNDSISITNNTNANNQSGNRPIIDSESEFHTSNLNLSTSSRMMNGDGDSNRNNNSINTMTTRRTHRRSESEPSMQNMTTTSGCESSIDS